MFWNKKKEIEKEIDPRVAKGPVMDLFTHHRNNDTDVWCEYKNKKKEVLSNRVVEILKEKISSKLSHNDIYQFIKRGMNFDIRIEDKKFIKFHNIEHLDAEISYNKPLIKKICEDLYYNGKIERTGNYKYSYKSI